MGAIFQARFFLLLMLLARVDAIARLSYNSFLFCISLSFYEFVVTSVQSSRPVELGSNRDDELKLRIAGAWNACLARLQPCCDVPQCKNH